jgi:hypothetical protein
MNQSEQINFQELFENIQKDPTLLSNINITELLKIVKEDSHSTKYLLNKTFNTIKSDILDILDTTFPYLNPYQVQSFSKTLFDFRYVDEIYELHKGKYVRWIKYTNTDETNIPKLTTGGFVVNIKFLDNGIYILCKNNRNQFIQYKYDDCITFQKLSYEEHIILMIHQTL